MAWKGRITSVWPMWAYPLIHQFLCVFFSRKLVFLPEFTFMAQWWAGSECTVVLEKPEDYDLIGKEHNITIMNHKYDIDWLMAWILAERFQMLGVSNKVIVLRETMFSVLPRDGGSFFLIWLLEAKWLCYSTRFPNCWTTKQGKGFIWIFCCEYCWKNVSEVEEVNLIEVRCVFISPWQIVKASSPNSKSFP